MGRGAGTDSKLRKGIDADGSANGLQCPDLIREWISWREFNYGIRRKGVDALKV